MRASALPGVLMLALGTVGAVASACGDSSTPGGHGNDVVNDTRDSSTRAPANPDPGDGSVLSGEPDGAYLGGQPEGSTYYEGGTYDDAPTVSFPGLAQCSACTCGAGRDYCFGGASPKSDPQTHVTSSATDAGGAVSDGGVPACPIVTAGELGCTALPASCVNANPADDCPCLAALLQAQFGCILNCAYDGKTSTLYCPNP